MRIAIFAIPTVMRLRFRLDEGADRVSVDRGLEDTFDFRAARLFHREFPNKRPVPEILILATIPA